MVSTKLPLVIVIQEHSFSLLVCFYNVVRIARRLYTSNATPIETNMVWSKSKPLDIKVFADVNRGRPKNYVEGRKSINSKEVDGPAISTHFPNIDIWQLTAMPQPT